MNTLSIVTMILILTVVWGGLAVCLVIALRRESGKNRKPR